MPRLNIYKSERETCYAFADRLVQIVAESLAEQDRFTIAISPAEIPKQLFKILATEYVEKIDWSKIVLFLADDRIVTGSDDKNSGRAAFKTFIEQLGITTEQVHFTPTDLPPDQCANKYGELLKRYFVVDDATFDLAIIGMSEDGAILSLLPGNEEVLDSGSMVKQVYNDREDVFCVTLTPHAINAAKMKAFVVTGKKKEDIVQQVLKGKYDPEKFPAQLIQTANKSVHWFLDEAAAGKLIKPNL